MDFSDSFKNNILKIDDHSFSEYAIKAFHYQYQTNQIYRSYCNYLKKNPDSVTSLTDIPFLPIEFFRDHIIKSGEWIESDNFLSSGTTATSRSRHLVRDIRFYEKISSEAFKQQYGDISTFRILALLPSYQEQGHSSLIRMVDHFINNAQPGSGYFLHNSQDLKRILENEDENKLLIGVSYALIDFIEKFPELNPKNLIIMETGGMKGRRKEITRVELHEILKQGFSVNEIHSEYGMTELYSQAYSKNDGIFSPPRWMKVLIREINDPFSFVTEKTGGINIIDLANIDTCCFIETKDLGKEFTNNKFEVQGRFDNSDLRGCNLMVQ